MTFHPPRHLAAPEHPFTAMSLEQWDEQLQTASNPEHRYKALMAVNYLATTVDAFAAQVRSLGDGDPLVRALAARQLGQLRRSPKAAEINDSRWPELTPLLEPLLESSDPDTRFEAARTLLRIEGTHAAAKATVFTFLDERETSPLMQAALAEALGEISGSDEEVVTRLIPLLQHHQAEVRENTTAALIKFREAATPALPHVLPLVDDEEPWVRENATHIIAQTGHPTPEVLAALQTASEDEDEQVAEAAKQAILAVQARALS